jgi:hypothetical protein
MDLQKIIFLKNHMLKNAFHSVHTCTAAQAFIIFASQTDSAGGQANNSRKQEIDASQASDNKRAKGDNIGRAEAGSEDITNKAKDQQENASITQPDTNLTGDTGNLDIGQTDLGASGTGAENI